MRSDLVVLPEPNIDSDLCLPCGVEPFSVEDFFSQGAVKAFVVSIFPRTAWIRLRSSISTPGEKILSARRHGFSRMAKFKCDDGHVHL